MLVEIEGDDAALPGDLADRRDDRRRARCRARAAAHAARTHHSAGHGGPSLIIAHPRLEGAHPVVHRADVAEQAALLIEAGAGEQVRRLRRRTAAAAAARAAGGPARRPATSAKRGAVVRQVAHAEAAASSRSPQMPVVPPAVEVDLARAEGGAEVLQHQQRLRARRVRRATRGSRTPAAGCRPCCPSGRETPPAGAARPRARAARRPCDASTWSSSWKRPALLRSRFRSAGRRTCARRATQSKSWTCVVVDRVRVDTAGVNGAPRPSRS